MQITIGGVAGTGKGTVGRMLAERLGYKFVSGGDLFRKAAEDHGMTMEEFDAYSKEHKDARHVDKEIDQIQIDMGTDDDNFILESRLAWYFIPQSIKIKLDADLDERIRRIAGDTSTDRIAYQQEDFETTKKKTLKRFKDHQEKITELYGIEDMVADEHFDLVVDTTHLTPEEVVEEILTYIKTK